MKRRRFSATLVTAAASMSGLTGLTTDVSAQSSGPLQIRNGSVTSQRMVTAASKTELAFEDGTLQFELSDWQVAVADRSVTIDTARVTLDGVSSDAHSTIRDSIDSATDDQSLSPLLAGLAEADVDADTSVRVSAGPITDGDRRVVSKISLASTVGAIVPEEAYTIAEGDTPSASALGASKWDYLTVECPNARLKLTDLTIRPRDGALSLSASRSSVQLPDRTFELKDASVAFRPPASIPEAHRNLAKRLRELVADRALSLDKLKSVTADSDVTLANTKAALCKVQADVSVSEVTKDGEVEAQDLDTSETLAALAAGLQQKVRD